MIAFHGAMIRAKAQAVVDAVAAGETTGLSLCIRLYSSLSVSACDRQAAANEGVYGEQSAAPLTHVELVECFADSKLGGKSPHSDRLWSRLTREVSSQWFAFGLFYHTDTIITFQGIDHGFKEIRFQLSAC